MELNFGKWVVNESGIYLERNRGNFHTINKKELWKVREYNGVLVWDWFIHFSGQCWFDRTNLNDFVVAFAFAQDYLKQYKPENAKMASIAQSIYIAQQMISIDADLEESPVASDIKP